MSNKKKVDLCGLCFLFLTNLFSALVFTKIAKSYIEDYMQVVIKLTNYECKYI